MSALSIAIDLRHPSRPPVLDQVNSLAIDLARLGAGGDSPSRGVGLAAVHAALRLAVTPAADEDEQMIKHEVLVDAADALTCAGFGHARALIDVALSFDVLAGRLQRGNALVQ